MGIPAGAVTVVFAPVRAVFRQGPVVGPAVFVGRSSLLSGKVDVGNSQPAKFRHEAKHADTIEYNH